MSIDGQTWKKSINFYLDSTCYSSPRIHRCGVNRSDVCPAAKPSPLLCPWAPTETARGTGTEEQGPYIQFLSRSCPVQEQSHRADHEAGPQKEQNIQGGRMLLRMKQHMVGLWQKDGHVTSQDVCIWTYSLTAKFLLPAMLIYFQMRKKVLFSISEKCKYHPQLRACMIIIKHFS